MFSNFMRSDPVFMKEGGPDWTSAVRKWNTNANGNSIFYKVFFFSLLTIITTHYSVYSLLNTSNHITMYGQLQSMQNIHDQAPTRQERQLIISYETLHV